MEWNEIEMKIIEKANFYKDQEIVAHVLTIPKGTFKNGMFVSHLEQDKYFWFIECKKNSKELTGVPARLFLSEIYDVKDYSGEQIEGGNN